MKLFPLEASVYVVVTVPSSDACVVISDPSERVAVYDSYSSTSDPEAEVTVVTLFPSASVTVV